MGTVSLPLTSYWCAIGKQPTCFSQQWLWRVATLCSSEEHITPIFMAYHLLLLLSCLAYFCSIFLWNVGLSPNPPHTVSLTLINSLRALIHTWLCLLSWRWRQQVPPNLFRKWSTRLNSFTSQKIVIFISQGIKLSVCSVTKGRRFKLAVWLHFQGKIYISIEIFS